MPDWLKSDPPTGIPILSDRNTACLVLEHIDYDFQIYSIRRILQSNNASRNLDDQRILELQQLAKDNTISNSRVVEELIEAYHESVFDETARSMAAVGLLSPFIESIFKQAFMGIKKHSSIDISSHTERALPPDKLWDCRYFMDENGKKSKGIARGIQQLSDVLNLSKFFPHDYYQSIDALFSYRNAMFHNGYEWPRSERIEFNKLLTTKQWPIDCFKRSESGGEPWTFRMSTEFVDRCVLLVDELLEGIGKFCKAEILS